MTCVDERRRGKVRERGFNGIDAISVDGEKLTVIFFGSAPEHLSPANFRIDGGRRITGIEVVDVHECVTDDPELEDRVVLTVDRVGDLSTYRLCVVEAGPCGEPGSEPFPGFDPRYACLEFTFSAGCGDLDCATVPDCPQETVAVPEIDYLAKDYASFRQLLLDRLSLTMPGWTERHVPDIGIALVELLAYEGDRLSYRQDAVATEAYLDTARRRISVRRHTRLVDYAMHDGCAARAWVCVEAQEKAEIPAGDFRFVTLPDGELAGAGKALLNDELSRRGLPGFQVFEPVHREDPLVLHPAHNEIHFWTWGDFECCLPTGTTSATLVDGEPCGERVLCLEPGDVLVFEEILGPKTGVAADADHSHRQAVRLTSVTMAVDELFEQPVLEVTWAREDALTFPLCVNARGGPECAELEVGIARGNVVLVEHGSSNTFCHGDPETLPVPIEPPDEPGCADPPDFGCPEAGTPSRRPAYPPLPVRFDPELANSPVTQSAPFPAPAQVAEAQARWLLGLPDRARARLNEIWRRARHHHLSEEDVHYLETLFGKEILRRLHLEEHPKQALRILVARFDELLARKLARLAELIRRARAGYVLKAAAEGWEIGQSWGERERAAIDEHRAVFRGAAVLGTTPDPRAALPAVTVTDQLGNSWLPRRDLLDSDATDRHFVGETSDEGTMSLRFGDGRNGARFPLRHNEGEPNASAAYRVGNGLAGNVGREAINRIVFCETRVSGITAVRNPLPATGGVDPEPVAEVRRRAPREPLRKLLRAITADDYATLAGQVPGVQRAAADLRWTGSWYEAQVALDPLGAEIAPDFLLDEARQALHRFRRIGHDLAVSTATLVPLDVALSVEVLPDHVSGHVRAALLRAFAAYFTPDNLTFGTPIRASSLVATAAAVPGVRHVEVTRLQRLFGPLGHELEDGILPIRPLEVAQLDNDPARQENGRLTLDLAGGR